MDTPSPIEDVPEWLCERLEDLADTRGASGRPSSGAAAAAFRFRRLREHGARAASQARCPGALRHRQDALRIFVDETLLRRPA